MRMIASLSVILIFALSAFGCFVSRTESGEFDSGSGGTDSGIETRESDSSVISVSKSDGSEIAYSDGGEGDVGPTDAATVDSMAVQGGTGDSSAAAGIGVDAETMVIADAPCSPHCPVLEWVTIPGGSFQMGSPDGIGYDREHPRHEVTVQSYQILKSEVTVSQYATCFDAGICGEPYGVNNENFEDWYNWGKADRENHPIDGVYWNDAKAFAEWVGARLPTEAEWEYAARSGGQDITYPWGNEEPTCQHAVIGQDINREYCVDQIKTMQACSTPLGNTAQGVCDMAGNVSELVEDDLHDSYEGAPDDGSAWIDEPRSVHRVVRGGSWDYDNELCRCTFRSELRLSDAVYGVGFRIARDLIE